VGGARRGDPTDRDLVAALGAGEPWAMAETWNRFAPMVLTTARRALGSRTEAEDVVQDVFIQVFRKACTLRDPDSLRSFIYSFAVRVLKAELRRRKIRGWLLFLPDAPLDYGARTLDVEARDLLRKLYALLDRLSPRNRLAFVLRRMEAMTVEEIAATMDISTFFGLASGDLAPETALAQGLVRVEGDPAVLARCFDVFSFAPRLVPAAGAAPRAPEAVAAAVPALVRT